LIDDLWSANKIAGRPSVYDESLHLSPKSEFSRAAVPGVGHGFLPAQGEQQWIWNPLLD
jgi:hypothetical protein